MSLFRKKKPSFKTWLQSATDQELADGYERCRLEWLKNGQNGTGIKTPEMQMIDREISSRSAEKWEKTHVATPIPIIGGQMQIGGIKTKITPPSLAVQRRPFCMRVTLDLRCLIR